MARLCAILFFLCVSLAARGLVAFEIGNAAFSLEPRVPMALAGTTISVSMSPTSAKLSTGGIQGFTATVKGSTQGVTWSVLESGGGAITSAGTYTAPNIAGTFTVQAASVENPAKVARATVQIFLNPDSTLSAPGYAKVGETGLKASVPAQSGATYAWSISGGRITAGAATASATFTAGTSKTMSLTCKVTNGAGSSSTSAKSIQLATLVLDPDTAYVRLGGYTYFRLGVGSSAPGPLTWNVLEPGGGEIDAASGNYVAPSTPGVFTVQAVCITDPSVFGFAKVHAEDVSKVKVEVSPLVATLGSNQSQTFTIKISGTGNPEASVSQEPVAGKLASSRTGDTTTLNFTATGTPGVYGIEISSAAYPDRKAAAHVLIEASGGPVISAFASDRLEVQEGESLQLSWSVQGATSLYLQSVSPSGRSSKSLLMPDPTSTGTRLQAMKDWTFNGSYLDSEGWGVQRYVLIANGTDRQGHAVSAYAEIPVRVKFAYISAFTADKAVITPGDPVRLTAFFNGTGSITPEVGPVENGQTIQVNPPASRAFTLEVANGFGGEDRRTLKVTALAPRGAWLQPSSMPFTWTGQAIRLWDNRVGFLATDRKFWVQDPDSGIFSFVGAFSQDHAYGTLVALADGRVAGLGGYLYGYGYQEPEVLDPRTGQAANLPARDVLRRIELGAALMLDGRVLVWGGRIMDQYGDFTSDPRAVLYDPASGGVETLGDLPGSFPHHALLPSGDVVLNGGPSHFNKGGLALYLAGEKRMVPLSEAEGSPALLADGTVLQGSAYFSFNSASTPGGSFDPATGQYATHPEFGRYGGSLVAVGDGGALAFDPPDFYDPSGVVSLMLPQGKGAGALPKPPLPIPADPPHPGILMPDGTVRIDSALSFDPQLPLQINPAAGMAQALGTIVFRATGNLASGGVRWSCDAGSMGEDGAWIAPEAGGLYRVIATSVSEPTVACTAWVRVSGVTKVVVTAPRTVLAKGESVQLGAVVTGSTNQGVIWSVLEPNAGSITPSGLFTAGNTSGVFTVGAASVVDPRMRGQIQVAVNPDGAPRNAMVTLDTSLAIYGSQVAVSFTALEGYSYRLSLQDPSSPATPIYEQTYSNPGNVTWTLSKDLFNVPSHNYWVATSHGGFFKRTLFRLWLYATNPLGTTSTYTPITLVDERAFEILPRSSSILPNQSKAFAVAPVISGAPTPAVTWTSSGGTIGTDGIFTAPATGGLFKITASSVDEPEFTDSAYIQVVTTAPVISYFGPNTTVWPGKEVILNWSVTGASTLSITTSTGEEIPFSDTSTYGQYSVRPPLGITHYTLTATNAFGSTSWGPTWVDVKPVTVSVSPTQMTLVVGASSTVTATSPFQTVWSVQEGAAGGNIYANSNPGTYTAPASPGVYHIVATSYVEPLIQATIQVTVEPPGVSISPKSIQLQKGETFQFGVAISGDNQVSWSVQEGAAGGSITSAGAYTAPEVPGTYHVVASSVKYPGAFDVSTVTVAYPAVTLEVTAVPDMYPTQTIQMGLTSSDGLVDWVATGGTIDSNGLYEAPLEPGTYQIIAISRVNPNVTSTVQVTVKPIVIAIKPNSINLATNSIFQFGFEANFGLVEWACSAGSITQTGQFIAPTTIGQVAVTLRSKVDPSVTDSAAVAVNEIGLRMDPLKITLPPGARFHFNYYSAVGAVTWSSTGGVFDPAQDGWFTAAAQPGTYQVTLASSERPELIVVGQVFVVPAQMSLTVSPAKAKIRQGETVRLRALGGAVASGVEWRSDVGTLLGSGEFIDLTWEQLQGVASVNAIFIVDGMPWASCAIEHDPRPTLVLNPSDISIAPGTSTTIDLQRFPSNAGPIEWSIGDLPGALEVIAESQVKYTATSVDGQSIVLQARLAGDHSNAAYTIVRVAQVPAQSSNVSLKLLNIVQGGLNPIVDQLNIGVSGGTLSTLGIDDSRVQATLNGLRIPLSSIHVTEDSIAVNARAFPGLNVLEISCNDSGNKSVIQKWEFISGERTLRVQVVDANGIPVSGAKILATVSKTPLVEVSGMTRPDGYATFSNLIYGTVPLSTFVEGKGSAIGFGGSGETVLQLKEIGSPSLIDNNDFHLGLDGWDVGNAPVEIVLYSQDQPVVAFAAPEKNSTLKSVRTLAGAVETAAVGLPYKWIQLRSSGEGPQSISRTFQTRQGTKRVRILYVFSTGEFPRWYQSQYNDAFSLQLRSKKLGPAEPVQGTVNMYAMSSYRWDGALPAQEYALKTDPSGDVVQLDISVSNVGDDKVDSSVLIAFFEENSVSIEVESLNDIGPKGHTVTALGGALQYLSVGTHPYLSYGTAGKASSTGVKGRFKITGANGDTIQDIKLDVLESGRLVAVGDLEEAAKNTLLKTFDDEHQTIEWNDPGPLFHIDFQIPSNNASSMNINTDVKLNVRIRVSTVNGQQATSDLISVGKLVRYTGFNRYSVPAIPARDEDVGGDDWCQVRMKNFMAHFSNEYPLLIGDFSNMNGGPWNPPHAEHQFGLNADMMFINGTPYASSLAAAQVYVLMLNDPEIGSSIRSIRMDLSDQTVKDYVINALVYRTRPDGHQDAISALYYIIDDYKHDGHVHITFNQ